MPNFPLLSSVSLVPSIENRVSEFPVRRKKACPTAFALASQCPLFSFLVLGNTIYNQAVDPEQIAAFLKPGGGVIEPTADPPLELKTQGLLGEQLFCEVPGLYSQLRTSPEIHTAFSLSCCA